jgi:hypothetical protein
MADDYKDESIRAYLERREKELVRRLADQHLATVMIEAELAEVRRAKNAVVSGATGLFGLRPSVSSDPYQPSRANLIAALLADNPAAQVEKKEPAPEPERNIEASQVLEDAKPLEGSVHQASTRLQGSASIYCEPAHFKLTLHPPRIEASSPYANLTMKQLTIKALNEHFEEGATAKDLIDLFRNAYGRDIKRENLSPQLSRLLKDAIIGRRGHTWFLKKETPTEDQSEGVSRVTEGPHEPLKSRE